MLGLALLAWSAYIGDALSAPSASQTSVVDGVKWSVTDFTRDCIHYPGSCIYNFTIVANATPSSQQENFISTCIINDTSSDPVHNSLDSVRCEDPENRWDLSQWAVSWGYNAAHDFAVMTLLSEEYNEDAWFGYNDVSNSSSFEDVGPNKVFAVGSFT